VAEDMENLLENEPIFDVDALKDMPDEWVRFAFTVIIPKIRLVLLNEQTTLEREYAIMEAQSFGMECVALIGQDFQDINLSFGKFNIIDNTADSNIYQFLFETVFPGRSSSEGK
jgi:hypothetical protein